MRSYTICLSVPDLLHLASRLQGPSLLSQTAGLEARIFNHGAICLQDGTLGTNRQEFQGLRARFYRRDNRSGGSLFKELPALRRSGLGASHFGERTFNSRHSGNILFDMMNLRVIPHFEPGSFGAPGWPSWLSV